MSIRLRHPGRLNDGREALSTRRQRMHVDLQSLQHLKSLWYLLPNRSPYGAASKRMVHQPRFLTDHTHDGLPRTCQSMPWKEPHPKSKLDIVAVSTPKGPPLASVFPIKLRNSTQSSVLRDCFGFASAPAPASQCNRSTASTNKSDDSPRMGVESRVGIKVQATALRVERIAVFLFELS